MSRKRIASAPPDPYGDLETATLRTLTRLLTDWLDWKPSGDPDEVGPPLPSAALTSSVSLLRAGKVPATSVEQSRGPAGGGSDSWIKDLPPAAQELLRKAGQIPAEPVE